MVCLSNSPLDREVEAEYTLTVQAVLCNETVQPCQPDECSPVTIDGKKVVIEA